LAYGELGKSMRLDLKSAPVQDHTRNEIAQQPDLWLTTSCLVQQAVDRLSLSHSLETARVLITGAGTSAYIASAIAAAWPRAIAVPSTDLLVDTERYLPEVDVLISVGRSGNSPEGVAAAERVSSLRPEIVQLAITCNHEGALAKSPLIRSILLDPRTDDKSLVMTSSFSNLTIAGLYLCKPKQTEKMISVATKSAKLHFSTIDSKMQKLANQVRDRIVFLTSSPMFGWAMEGSLKSLEMTAGQFPVLAETFLGLRHGPMAFVQRDTVVVCLLSNDPLRRKYEIDLVRELRNKEIGYLVGIGCCGDDFNHFDETVPAISSDGNDDLRVPFEILGPQLLGYHLSHRVGLSPDNPSRSGIITRVVQGVIIHTEA
jgi:tagatose-6-phosphate ketose/aldose isomerase